MRTNITMLVHDRPRLTAQALFSLDPLPEDASLTILDDASSEETSMILRAYQQSHKDENVLVWRNEESAGTGEARNQVIKLSQQAFGRGEYLYLSDNDVYFTRADWLDILVRCYERAWLDGFRVVGAYNHPFHMQGERVYTADAWAVAEVQALALQSMIMRWEVWDGFGPFERTPVGAVCQGEDVTFSMKITATGGKLGVVSPALLVNTGVTNSFGQPIPGAEHVLAQAPRGVIVE